MKTKEIILNSLHKIVRKDQYINDLLIAPGSHLDLIKEKKEYLNKEFLFSTMSLERIEALEKELNYKVKAENLEGKRIEIEARWKSSGKCDLIFLQKIADTWDAGKIIVRFNDATIQLGFTGEVQEDYDFLGLKNSIEEVKPAHLGLNFIYNEKINTSLFLNSFMSEELEEDFIEKNKTIDINCYYYNNIFIEIEEVNKNYGI